jgi:hypothetical protein
MACAPGCSSLGDIIERLGADLNDADHVQWTRPVLIGFINEALCTIHAHRPDAFSSTEVISLQPGTQQKLPVGVSDLVQVWANVTVDGSGVVTDGKPVSSTDTNYTNIFRNKRKCLVGSNDCVTSASASAYAVSSATKNPVDENSFDVSPPVPQGIYPQVRATVIKNPTRHIGTKLNECLGVACNYEAQVITYALYRAYCRDTESTTMMAASERFRKAFYEAVSADYLQDQRFHSGLFKGQDPKRPYADNNFRQH